jgi:ferritin-like metal-binding protein YciE
MPKPKTKQKRTKNTGRQGQSNKMANLQDLFILKLQALLEVENALIKALPKMADASSSEELDEAFRDHLQETEMQANRLEGILEKIEEKPKKVGVEAIVGMIDDAKWVIDNIEPEALDAALIASARYVEHYEIAGYETASEWARELGFEDIEEVLRESLTEEENANNLLSTLAIAKINRSADMDDDMEDEDIVE